MSDEPTNGEPSPSEPEREREDTTGAKATKLAKRKRRGAATSEPAAAATTPPGEGTPEGEKLREANAAFEAGNYALVRTLTAELERASDPKVVDAARDLARRIAVDPVQIAFLGLCAVALLVITYVYVLAR